MDRALTNKITHGCGVFDNTTGYINCGTNAALNITGSITIEAWIHITTLDADGSCVVTWAQDYVVGDPYSYHLVILGDGTIRLNRDSAMVDSNAGAVTAGVWQHVAVTHNTSTGIAKHFVNGVEVKSISYNPTIRAGSKFLSISRSDHQFLGGNIDEVRIWNYSRTAEQILANYKSVVKPQAGLVGYWKLDNNALDSSGNGNNGTVNGGVTWSDVVAPNLEKVRLVTSGLNGSAEFDGVDDSVVASGFSWNSLGAITVEFWNHVKTVDVQNSSVFSVQPSNSGPDERIQGHAPWGDKVLYWDYGDINGTGRLSADYTPYLDKWTHVALVSKGRGGGFMAIYLDGVLVASSANSDAPDTLRTELAIGRWYTSYHKGKISDLRIWNVARTAEEIKANYKSRIAAQTNLVGYWKLAGNVLDSSSAGNNGVLNGAILGLDSPLNSKLLTSRSKQPYALNVTTDGLARIPATPDLELATMSWAFWVKYTTIDNFPVFELRGGTTDTANDSYQFQTGSDIFTPAYMKAGHLFFFPGYSGGINEANGFLGTTKPINDGKWHHFAVTYDKAIEQITLYCDGVQHMQITKTQSLSFPKFGGKAWDIGSRNGAASFGGELMNLSMFNRIITLAEVRENMLEGVTGTESGILTALIAHPLKKKLVSLTGKYNADLYNDAEIIPSTVPVGQRSSLSFDTDKVATNLGWDNKGEITVEAWVYALDVRVSFIFNMLGDVHNIRTSIAIWSDSVLYWDYGTTDPATDRISTPYASSNYKKWTHIACVSKGTTANFRAIYIDGELVVSNTNVASSTIPTATRADIGNSPLEATYFNGMISNVRVWNKAITQSEIKANMYRYLPSTTPNLVEQWKLDEGVGTVVYGTKGNNGTITGATWKEPTLANWRSGHVKMDGVDDYVKVTENKSLDLIEQGTIELYAKTSLAYPSSTSTTVYKQLVNKSITGNTPDICYWIDWFGTSTTRELRAGISNGSVLQTVSVSNFDFANTWKHIVFSFDGSSLNLYVDGVLLASTSQTIKVQIISTASLRIGQGFSGDNSYFWNGTIDEIRLWNKGNTQSEIQENMNRVLGRHPNLVGYWRFDHDGYWDASGNGNHGTPVNNPVIENNDNNKLNYIAPIN